MAKLEDMSKNRYDSFEQNFHREHTFGETKHYEKDSGNQQTANITGKTEMFPRMDKKNFRRILEEF
jgi:hypothetical protein